MASILEFRRPELRSGTARSSAGGGASADIVLFPGVRYERWDDEAAASASAPRSRPARRRDRLELDD